MDYQQFHALCGGQGQPLGRIFETMIQAWYTSELGSRSSVIDGGAFRGRHTAPVARVIAPGTVHAFEPVPASRESLINRLAEDGIDNVTVHPLALADFSGPSSFSYVVNAAGYSGLKPRAYPQTIEVALNVETIEVMCTRLDDLIGTAIPDHIDFMKLDLEGGEFDALRGAGTVVDENRPIIAFENGLAAPAEIYGYSSQEFLTWFEEHGMTLVDVFGNELRDNMWDQEPKAFYFWALPTEQLGPRTAAIRRIRRKVLESFGLEDVTAS